MSWVWRPFGSKPKPVAESEAVVELVPALKPVPVPDNVQRAARALAEQVWTVTVSSRPGGAGDSCKW